MKTYYDKDTNKDLIKIAEAKIKAKIEKAKTKNLF